MPMTSSDYREQAEQCRVEAERAQGSEKQQWLQLHRAWLALADHNEQQPADYDPEAESSRTGQDLALTELLGPMALDHRIISNRVEVWDAPALA